MVSCCARRMRTIAVSLFLLALVFGIGAPVAYTKAPAAEPVADTSITVIGSAEITSLDPSVETHRSANAVQNTMLETFAIYDTDMTLTPQLAETWERLDPNTWRLTLREGVKFHNGEDLTSESVKASVDAFNASKGFAGSWFQYVKEVKIVDDLTVDIVTEEPTPVMPMTLAFLYAFPPKYFAEVGAEKFGQEPIGTGPYMFDEWVRGDYIKVKQNPDYWGDQSNIEEIVFRTTSEASMRVAMLTTGEADLITNIPPQMIDQVEQAGALVKPVRGARRVFVEFNRFDPLLQDVRLRQALAYSVDVDAIIDSVFSGGAYKAKGVLRPGYVGFDENNVMGYDYNPEKAKELMTEAGYPDGFETDLYVGVGRLTLDKELAEALVGQWQKAGIKVNLHAMEWGAYVTQRFTQEMPAMGIISHAPMWWDGDYSWQNHFWSEGTWHYAHTPYGDEMFFAQRSESDPDKRAELEQALEKYWIDEEAASIILYDQQDVYGTSARFQWEPRQDELILFQEATLVE